MICLFIFVYFINIIFFVYCCLSINEVGIEFIYIYIKMINKQ